MGCVVILLFLVLQWVATPVNDMYADAVLSAILQAEAIGGSVSKTIPLPALKMDRAHFKVISPIIICTLSDLFGQLT